MKVQECPKENLKDNIVNKNTTLIILLPFLTLGIILLLLLILQ